MYIYIDWKRKSPEKHMLELYPKSNVFYLCRMCQYAHERRKERLSPSQHNEL